MPAKKLPDEDRRDAVLCFRVKRSVAAALVANGKKVGLERTEMLRTIFALGSAAWQQGHRSPETIKKVAK